MLERRERLKLSIINRQEEISKLFICNQVQVYIEANSQLKYWLLFALRVTKIECKENFDEQIDWVLCEDVSKQMVYKEKIFPKFHILLNIINSCIEEEGLINYYFHFWTSNNVLMAQHQNIQENDKLFCAAMDFMITEKCSLNCQDCLNLMQYYKKPQDYGLERLKEDINVISDIFDRVIELRILGGEPFVNKEIYDICKYISAKDNIEKIVIFTNATIIPDEQELKKISNKKSYFYISDYGVKQQKISRMKEILDNNGYSYWVADFSKSKWLRCSVFKDNRLSKEEREELFENCDGRKCPTVSNGKLFICEYLANAFNLKAIPNSKFNYVELKFRKESECLKNICKEYLYEKKILPGCSFCSRLQQEERNYVEPAIQIKNKLEYKRYE